MGNFLSKSTKVKTTIILFIASSTNSVNGFFFNTHSDYPLSLKNECNLLKMDQECPNQLFQCIDGNCIQVYSSTVHYLFGNRRILSDHNSTQSISKDVHPMGMDGIAGKYHGVWDEVKNQPQDGKGIFYANGNPRPLFNGMWEGGNFVQGHVVLYYKYPHNLQYDGNFENGAFNGYGVLYHKYPHSLEYDGNFENGAFNGYGVYYPNGFDGIKYDGNFKDGFADGQGTMYDLYPNEEHKIFEGEWQSGKFVRGIQYNSKGQAEYEGTFQSNGKGWFEPTWETYGKSCATALWKVGRMMQPTTES